MAFNFEEIAQKQDRLLANISEQNRKAYEMFYSPTPTDVVLPQYDENGTLGTVTIPNRAKIKNQMWDDVGAAIGQFNRYLYVDGVNGNDTGSGTAADPFKTLKKAVDSVPVGGRAVIYAIGDITCSSDTPIVITGKIIILMAHTSTPNATIRFLVTSATAPITLYESGSLIIRLNTSYENAYDTTMRWCILCSANSYVGIDNNLQATSVAGQLVRSVMSVGSNVYPFYVKASSIQIDNADITFGTNAQLCAFSLVSASLFGFYMASTTINGATPTGADVAANVSGIVKDVNGVPRNITSNIIF